MMAPARREMAGAESQPARLSSIDTARPGAASKNLVRTSEPATARLRDCIEGARRLGNRLKGTVAFRRAVRDGALPRGDWFVFGVCCVIGATVF